MKRNGPFSTLVYYALNELTWFMLINNLNDDIFLILTQ